MSAIIAPQPGIMDVPLYHGGAAHAVGGAPAVKLSSNENPWGPPPAAVAAIRAAAASAHRYPSSDHAALRAAIGAAHGLDPARIVCGAGSDEIIAWLCQAWGGPGIEVLYPRHGFLMYRISALAAGAAPVVAPEAARRVDPDALIAAATPATRLVFVADPANPTGTRIGPEALARIATGIPQALLVIDGAYAEYVPGSDGGAGLVDALPNVVMTRTFSKLYGLGGMRVGWCYARPEVVGVLNRMRGPFNLGQPAQDAAVAALGEDAWLARCRDETLRLRGALAARLAAAGIPSDPSDANFLLARFRDAGTAAAADAALQAASLVVRGVASYGLPECLRITIGDAAACEAVAVTLERFMAARA